MPTMITSPETTTADSLRRLWDGLLSVDVDHVVAARATLRALAEGCLQDRKTLAQGLTLYSLFRESALRCEKPDARVVQEAIGYLEGVQPAEGGIVAAIRDTSLGELMISLSRHQPAFTVLRSIERADCTARSFVHAKLLLVEAMVEADRRQEAEAVLRRLSRMKTDLDHRARILVEMLGLCSEPDRRTQRRKYAGDLEMLLQEDGRLLPAPVLYDAHVVCGYCCVSFADHEGAIRHFESAINMREQVEHVLRNPHIPYTTLGLLYLRREENALARSMLETALGKAQDPSAKMSAHLGLAAWHRKQGDADSAIDHYRQARELPEEGDERARVTFLMANQCRLAERWAEAYGLFSELLHTDVPDDKVWRRRRDRHFYLGLCLFKLGRWDEARHHLRKPITVWSRLFGVNLGMESGSYFYLGSIAEQEGKLKHAIRLYRKARKHAWTEEKLYRSPDPQQCAQWLVDIYLSIARCYEKLGKHRKAAQYREEASQVPDEHAKPTEERSEQREHPDTS
jgi:tetratricopeptide (TPR) repeat protein